MCDASSGEKGIAGKMKSFSDNMINQANEVFGFDNNVVNQLFSSYNKIVAKGPNQQGFSPAELRARQSEAITNNAIANRNAKAAVGNAQSQVGGGNTTLPSGAVMNENRKVATAFGENTSAQLNDISKENYATGRENFYKASAGEAGIPGIFDNAPGFDSGAQKGLDQSMTAQKSLDAASSWWQGPVKGLVGAGLTMATGGLSNVLTGAGSFAEGAGAAIAPRG